MSFRMRPQVNMSWDRWEYGGEERDAGLPSYVTGEGCGTQKSRESDSLACRLLRRRVGTRVARQEMPSSLRFREKESGAVLKGNLETRDRM